MQVGNIDSDMLQPCCFFASHPKAQCPGALLEIGENTRYESDFLIEGDTVKSLICEVLSTRGRAYHDNEWMYASHMSPWPSQLQENEQLPAVFGPAIALYQIPTAHAMTSIPQDPPTTKFIQKASYSEEEVHADSKALPEGGQASTRVRDETFYFEYTIFEVSAGSSLPSHTFGDTNAVDLGR